MFDITGALKVKVIGFCVESLESNDGTISIGSEAGNNSIINTTLASNIVANSVWIDNNPIQYQVLYDDVKWQILYNTEIVLDISTADITDGKLLLFIEYVPLTQNASIEQLI